MAVCVDFINGNVEQIQSSVEDCTAYVLVSGSEYGSYFEAFTLDPLAVSAAFGFGMGAILTCYLSAYPIGVIKRMILGDGRS